MMSSRGPAHRRRRRHRAPSHNSSSRWQVHDYRTPPSHHRALSTEEYKALQSTLEAGLLGTLKGIWDLALKKPYVYEDTPQR